MRAVYLFTSITITSSSNTTPKIVELATQISSSVTQLQEKLSEQGVATPSFAENGPDLLPEDVPSLKDAVDATAELHEIFLDPLLLLFKFASIENLVTLDGVCC
ncbi:hypothetical protein IQ06DRAFT_352317 [Phaeosphaeriaceae sp. SRC1lsM3a]|nr:hypothetical protein IQ06DRAFT_352317 [Stagonospora sp. SRC1lsM3a]